uniref:Uncharacterized protein n=1 Tax=Neolamprologus brichardi TaxID=32507 RepID=A0A3Q4HRJ1_NEOBR
SRQKHLERVKLGHSLGFQQDNDPKHCIWINQVSIKLMGWASQSLDLNAAENVWYKLNKEQSNINQNYTRSLAVAKSLLLFSFMLFPHLNLKALIAVSG